MLWPLVEPFKQTCWWLLAFITLLTIAAPLYKTKRVKAFRNTIILSVLLFIPSCLVIQSSLDAKRFGTFAYKTYAEVQDHRVERYLPPGANAITLNKFPSGHQAKYTITEEKFHAFLDGLWEPYGERSATRRESIDGKSKPAVLEKMDFYFQELKWKPLRNASIFHSPVERDGGGATYFFDTKTGIVYQRAGYW